jgi:hypothetical protein
MTELEKQTFDKANALIEKNKAIEEMAELERLLRIRRMDIEKQGCDIWALIKKTESEEQSIANYLIGQGYRKASEVAREIFEEIEKLFFNNHIESFKNFHDNWNYRFKVDMIAELAELKKKYTEEVK